MAKKKKDILIPTEANIVQPYFLTQEEIDRTPSTNILDIDYSKYKDYLGNNGQPVSISPEHWDEQRAKKQSGFAKFGNTFGQGLGTFGTSIASTAGVLFGIPYSAINAMQEGDQDNLGDLFANPVVKGIAEFDKYLKEEVFPTYYTKEQQYSIFSAATGTDLINGVGFLASALVPNSVVQKVFGGLSKAVQASRIGKFTATIDEAIAAGTISTEEAAKLNSLVNAINKTGEITGAVIGRLGESAIEANDSYDTVKASLIAARDKARYELDAYGETDDPDAANLSDQDIEAQAKSMRNNVFGGNMLLALSDFNQTMRWLGKGASIGDDIVKHGLKYAAKKEGALGFTSKILKEALQEAGEEGYQFVLQKAAEKARDFNGFSNAIGAATDDLFTTTEGIKSMLLGAVLGGGASVGFDLYNKKDKAKEINNIVENLNNNIDYSKRYVVDAEGKKVINPEIAKGNDRFIFYEALKEKALEEKDFDTYELLEKKQFAELVSSRQQAGKLDDLISDLEEVGKMSKQEVKALVGKLPINPITGLEMTPSEIAESKISEAKKLAKTVEGIKSIRQFAGLPPKAQSHIASLLVEQDVLKDTYVDLQKKVNNLATSPILKTTTVAPSDTKTKPQGSKEETFGLKDIEVPISSYKQYSALDEAKAKDLRDKAEKVEKRYQEINDTLTKYLEEPKKVVDKVTKDEDASLDKLIDEQEKTNAVKQNEKQVIEQIKSKTANIDEINRYQVVTKSGEIFYPTKTKTGDTILINNKGERLEETEDLQIVDIEEAEGEEVQFEKPADEWSFKKTTVFTSAGRNSVAKGEFNNLGDRRNLFLSPGRILFYKALDSVKGKLSMKIELASSAMIDELLIDDEGNKIPYNGRPIYVGYLYRDGKPVEENGIVAYNVLHDPENITESKFEIEEFDEEKEEYENFLQEVKEALIKNEDVFVNVTEISSGFVNITREEKPLKDIVKSPAVTSGGVTIAVSMVSNVTGKPVIVEDGKEVQDVEWSGRPYIRVKTGDGAKGPQYRYVELTTRNLNVQEVDNILIPLIIEYINGNDFVEHEGQKIPILSYESGTFSILDSFVAFIRSGNPDTSIYFGKGAESRTLYFGNSESGKIRLSKNNMENIGMLREFLLNKKRTVSRKYTASGRLKMTSKVTIPIITTTGTEFKTLTYLELLSGEQGFEAGLTSKLSPEGTVLNKYAVFEPIVRSKPNTTVSVKPRVSKKPKKETAPTEQDVEKVNVNLNQPINRLQYFMLSPSEQGEYIQNMVSQKRMDDIAGTPVEEYEDLFEAWGNFILEKEKENSSDPNKKSLNISFIDFAKDFLSPERFEEMKKIAQPKKPVFGKKEKNVSTAFYKTSDKQLRVGSYVTYESKKYIVYEVNGKLLLITDGSKVLEVKAESVVVEGGYAIGKYGKSSFIVTGTKVISTTTGKEVYKTGKTKKTTKKTKKGKNIKVRSSLAAILRSARNYFGKPLPEFKAPEEKPESLFVVEPEEGIVGEISLNEDGISREEIIIKRNEPAEVDSEGNPIKEESPNTEKKIAGHKALEDDEFDARDRQNNLPYKVGNIESAKKWLQEKLGVTPEVTEGLIQVGGYDFGLFGYFYNGVITLSDIMEEGTEYHEAFHLVSRMYLSDYERNKLYNEVRKKEGRNLTAKEAEEILAEDFRAYVMSDGKIKYPEEKKSIFRKILDVIKAFLGLPTSTVNDVFAKINAGYYNQQSYITSIKATGGFARDAGVVVSPSEKYRIDNTLKALFKDFLSSNKIPFYKVDLKNNIGSFNEYAKNHFSRYPSAFNLNPDYFLKKFKEDILEESKIDEGEEESRGREEKSKEFAEQAKVSSFVGISERMKFLFSTIIDPLSEPNELGSLSTIPESEVKAYLASILHDKFTLAEITDALDEERSIEPRNDHEIKTKAIAIQIRKVIGNPNTSNFELTMFRQEFFDAVTLVKQEMLMTLFFKPNRAKTGDVSVINTHVKKVKDRITEVLQGKILSSSYVVNTQGQKHIPISRWNDLMKLSIEDFFKEFGIELLNPDYKNKTSQYYLILEKFRNLINSFPTKTITTVDINGKKKEESSRTPFMFFLDDYISEDMSKGTLKASWRSLVEEILEAEIPYYTQVIESQAKNSEGESVYGYSKPSYIYQKIADIKKGLVQYGLAKNSKLWDSIRNGRVDIVLVDGERFNETGEEGIHVSKMTTEDMLLNRIVNLYGQFKDKKKTPTVNFLQMADKKSVYAMVLRDSNLIVLPSDIAYKEGKIVFGDNDDIVERLWNIYQNFIEFDNADTKRYVTFGTSRSYFEAEYDNKPIPREDFAKVVSKIVTKAAAETEKYSKRFIGNKEGKDVSVIPNEILALGKSSDSSTESEKLAKVLAGLVATELVTNLEQMSIFFGPPNLYKALFKRTPEVRASGRIASTDAELDEMFVNDRKRYGWTEEQLANVPTNPHHFKGSIFHDVAATSKYAEKYKKLLGEDFYGADEKGKGKINPVDGQGLIGFEFYREYSIRTGQWSVQAEDAFWKELQGVSTKYPFPPMKLVHYGEEQVSLAEGQFIPVYYKFSVYPLIPSLVKGRKLEKVRQDLLNSGSSLGIFDSGNKVGNLTTKANFGDAIPQEATHTLNVKDLKIQVDINPKKDKYELLIGTQLRKLINQNIADAGKDVKNPEVLEEFNQLVQELANVELENLADSLKTTSENLLRGEISNEAWTNLIELVKQAAIDNEESDNLIASLDFLKSKDMPIDIVPTRNKVQNMLNALINNRILKQKMRGRPYVQCSSVGFEYNSEESLLKAVKEGIVKTDSEFYRSHFVDGKFDNTNARLGFIDIENEKVIHAEILLPYFFKDKVDINNIDDKLLEALGYRIPTQGLNSMLMFKVVGFLPENTDQLAAVPYEITMQAGSDFDVDKLNTFLREYVVKIENGVKKLTPVSDNYEDSEELKELKEKQNKFLLNKDILDDMLEEEEIFEDDLNTPFDKKIESLERKLKLKHQKKVITDKLFSNMKRRLEDVNRFKDYITPNSPQNLEDDANYINSIQTSRYKLSVDFKGIKQFFTSSNIEVAKNFWSAKDGVGQAASQGTFTSLTQINPIYQNKYSDRLFVPENYVHKEDGKIVFGKLLNTAGMSIIDIIANQHLSGNVDAASKPFIFVLNANGFTNDVHYYLEAAGVPTSWVNRFMTQPILHDFVKRMEERNGIVSKKRSLILNEKKSEDEVIQKLISDYGGDPLRSEYLTAKKDEDGLRIPSTSGSDRTYTEKELEEFIKNPATHVREQLNILDDFLFYREWASQRRTSISAVKFDTQGAGKNLPETQIILYKYNKATLKNFFVGLESLVQNSILGVFKKNVVNLAQNLYGDTTLVEKSDSLRTVRQDMMDVLDENYQLNPENLYKMYGMLTNIILQNNLIPLEERELWWKKNMIGDQSISNRLAKLINSPQTKGNYLFDNLLSIDFSSNENEPDVIKFDNTIRIDKTLEQVINEAFVDFKARFPDLYIDMIKMSLFQTGAIESPVSFYKYIPVADFVSVVKPLIQNLNFNVVDVKKEVYKNLYSLKGLVKKVNSIDIVGEKSGLPEVIEVPVDKYPYDYILKTVPNDLALYERGTEKKDNVTFVKTVMKSTYKFYNGLIGVNSNVTTKDEVGDADLPSLPQGAVAAIKLKDGTLISIDSLNMSALAEAGYTREEAQEIIRKYCLGL